MKNNENEKINKYFDPKKSCDLFFFWSTKILEESLQNLEERLIRGTCEKFVGKFGAPQSLPLKCCPLCPPPFA